MIKKNFFLYFLSLIIIFTFFLLNNYIELTIWGVIKKVLLFEISSTSLNLLSNGIFPIFSFNLNLGFPIFADSQAGIFEPINFFYLIISGPINQINYSYFTHLSLFVISLFFLLHRVYKIDFNIALIVSFLNFFSPIHIGDAIHQNHLATISYMPLSILIIEKFLLKKKFYSFLSFFSPIILFQLLAGHYQYQLYCFVFYGLYFLISLFENKENNNKVLLKVLVFTLSFLIGFGLATFQLLPSLDLMLSGNRSEFDSTYLGSGGFSVISVYYKSLSKIFNNVEGSISSLGYIFIFIFSFHKILNTFNKKKIEFDKVSIKYLFIFFFILIISLGQNLKINNFIYSVIPFLENFRFPARFMQINSFCSLILLATGLNYFKNNDFKINNKIIVFSIISFVYLITLIHFSKYILNVDYFSITNKNLLLVFYPFLLIAISIVTVNYFENKKLFNYFLIFFLFLSLCENLLHITSFKQYSLYFKKDKILENQKKADEICYKYKVNSINIVGEFIDTEYSYISNYYNFDYFSPLTTKKCKVFYHHSREDVVKNGLGYNQSSLATHQMTHLSNYQNNYLNDLHKDFNEKRNMYLASFINNFVTSKVFFINKDKNEIDDQLINYSNYQIKKFIYDYEFEKKLNFFDNLHLFFKKILIDNYSLKIINLFPKIHSDDLNIIELEKFNFIPLWQSRDFYVLNKNRFLNLNLYSFGYKIDKNYEDYYIYYIPVSFCIGLLISFLFVLIYIFILIKLLFFKYQLKNP